jgi:hypothetical protein
MGANANTLLVDSTQPHGFKFGPPVGGSGAMTKIAEVVVGTAAATVLLSNLSVGNPKHLLVLCAGQDTAASTYLDLHMKINNDGAAADYTSAQFLQGQGTGASAGQQAPSTLGAICGAMPGIASNAGALGASTIWFPNTFYLQSGRLVIEDTIVVHSAGPTMIRMSRGFIWKANAPIDSLLFTAGGTAFAPNTIFSAYALQ